VNFDILSYASMAIHTVFKPRDVASSRKAGQLLPEIKTNIVARQVKRDKFCQACLDVAQQAGLYIAINTIFLVFPHNLLRAEEGAKRSMRKTAIPTQSSPAAFFRKHVVGGRIPRRGAFSLR